MAKVLGAALAESAAAVLVVCVPVAVTLATLAGVSAEEVDAPGQLVAVVHLGLCIRKQLQNQLLFRTVAILQ